MNWKPFFKEMEKKAVLAAVMGGLEALNVLTTAKTNRSSVQLDRPGKFDITYGADPYKHQFNSNNLKTPGRSL